MDMKIRNAVTQDARAIADIFNYYLANTQIMFQDHLVFTKFLSLFRLNYYLKPQYD